MLDRKSLFTLRMNGGAVMDENRPVDGSSESTNLRGETHLFIHTIVKPVLDFLGKPIRLVYSVGFFLLCPVYFFRVYVRCYLRGEPDAWPLKFKFLNPLEKHELAALFAWTWATISAAGAFFGGIDLSVEIIDWPLVGSLVTSLVFQVAYFLTVIVATLIIRLVGGGWITRGYALSHAAYYSFVLIFPIMTITLGAWLFHMIGDTATEIVKEPPEPGTAYPGAWGDPWKLAFLFIAFIGLAFYDITVYSAQAVLAFLVFITFLHPFYLLRRIYGVSLLRYTSFYIFCVILYFLVTGILLKIFETDLFLAAFLLPYFILTISGITID